VLVPTPPALMTTLPPLLTVVLLTAAAAVTSIVTLPLSTYPVRVFARGWPHAGDDSRAPASS
jgi:hypothetical protein